MEKQKQKNTVGTIIISIILVGILVATTVSWRSQNQHRSYDDYVSHMTWDQLKDRDTSTLPTWVTPLLPGTFPQEEVWLKGTITYQAHISQEDGDIHGEIMISPHGMTITKITESGQPQAVYFNPDVSIKSFEEWRRHS